MLVLFICKNMTMRIEASETKWYIFINLVWDDWALLIETPVFKKEDVKNVLHSYSLFIHSLVILENISTDEENRDANEEIIWALELDEDTHGKEADKLNIWESNWIKD